MITGCNSGIGRDAAAKLAASGYNVILACRSFLLCSCPLYFRTSPAITLIVETERRLQHHPEGESRRRTQAKAEDTKASIAQELSAVKKPLPREPVLTAMECDLASLSRYA